MPAVSKTLLWSIPLTIVTPEQLTGSTAQYHARRLLQSSDVVHNNHTTEQVESHFPKLNVVRQCPEL